MKKTLLFLLVCVLCNALMGQSRLVMNPMNGHGNMVRYDSFSGFHISCSQPAGSGDVHFALTDLNMHIDVFVASGLTVKDFEIIDRLVFFCGEKFGGGAGFLGWFNIDSLFYSGGNAHVDLTLSSLGLISLDNIELYHDQDGSIHVAGYGKEPNPYTPPAPGVSVCPNIYLAFEAVGSLTAGMQYRVLELDRSGCSSEIVDMTVTDNYVVYLEWSRSEECFYQYGMGILLQPFPKYNMFASIPNPYFYFETTDDHIGYAGTSWFVLPYQADPYSVPPRITHTIENEVAVCSYRRDFDYLTWFGNPTSPCGGTMFYDNTPTCLAIRTYNLSPLLTNNPVPMTNASIAPMTPGDVKSIDGFRYDEQKAHFVVLHRHMNLSGVDEHAVTTIDYSSGVLPASVSSYYQTYFNTINQWLPCSLCLTTENEYTVGGYIIAIGNNEYIYWHDNIVSPATGACDALIVYPMSPIPTMVAKDELNYNSPTLWTPLVFSDIIKKERKDTSCIIMCE